MPQKLWWLIVLLIITTGTIIAFSYFFGLITLTKYIVKGTPQSPSYTFIWQQPTTRTGEVETTKFLLRGIVSKIDYRKKILWVLTKYGVKQFYLDDTMSYRVAVVTKNLLDEGPHVQAWVEGDWLTIFDINDHNKQEKFIVSTQNPTAKQWLIFAGKRNVVEMVFDDDKKTLYGLTLMSWR